MERAIRYVRESFFEGSVFTTLADLNLRAWRWRDRVAHERPCPGDSSKTVAQVWEEERSRLLSLPAHPFVPDLVRPVTKARGLYVHLMSRMP